MIKHAWSRFPAAHYRSGDRHRRRCQVLWDCHCGRSAVIWSSKLIDKYTTARSEQMSASVSNQQQSVSVNQSRHTSLRNPNWVVIWVCVCVFVAKCKSLLQTLWWYFVSTLIVVFVEKVLQYVHLSKLQPCCSKLNKRQLANQSEPMPLQSFSLH